MKTENSFAVSRYENRNGVSSWRVPRWLIACASAKTSKPRKPLQPRKSRSNGPQCVPPLAFELFGSDNVSRNATPIESNPTPERRGFFVRAKRRLIWNSGPLKTNQPARTLRGPSRSCTRHRAGHLTAAGVSCWLAASWFRNLHRPSASSSLPSTPGINWPCGARARAQTVIVPPCRRGHEVS